MKKIADKQINVNYSFSLFSLLRRGIGIIIIIILATLLFNSNSKIDELLHNGEVLSDSLKLERNEKGELVAKISAYKTQRTEDFIKFATKDSLTKELQKEVKSMRRYLKRQGSVTKFSTQTDIEASNKTEVSGTIDYPVYKSSFNLDNWVIGNTRATKDSTYVDFKVNNDYSLTIGVEPTGFLGLGRGKPFGQVTNKNPYSTVKTMRTYNVALPKDKKWGIGAYIGVNPITGDPMLIIGGGYNLIKF